MIEIVKINDKAKECLHCKVAVKNASMYSLNIHYKKSGQETILCYKCLFIIATIINNQVLKDIIGFGLKELNTMNINKTEVK